MNRKYGISLSETERESVHAMQNDPATAKSLRKRCSVLLLADRNAGKPPTHEEISVRCGVSKVTVYTVIKEFDTQGMAHCLRRREHKNPPNPPIVTGEKEARIVALACGCSPEGYARWTVRLLREKVVELGIMETVSHETIRATLKKRDLSLT